MKMNAMAIPSGGAGLCRAKDKGREYLRSFGVVLEAPSWEQKPKASGLLQLDWSPVSVLVSDVWCRRRGREESAANDWRRRKRDGH